MNSDRVTSVLTILVVLAVTPASRTGAERLARITVAAGNQTRVDTPVSISLEGIAISAGYCPELKEMRVSGSAPVPSQFEAGRPGRLWWILTGTTAAGSERIYELSRPFHGREGSFERAMANGRIAREGFVRCENYVKGWLKHADAGTGLIGRNIYNDKGLWNAKDCAADNYPFMVVTASILDRRLFDGRMLDMLNTEKKLTCRIGTLPDAYSFARRNFQHPELDINRIIFGASEYTKDGLLPLTEWLGASPWRERMLEIVDDIWRYAPVDTPYGKIVSENQEVNGEMLQTLSRLYWMTGDNKYLSRAIRLGDYYLLGGHHPTRDETKLRLRDHGCEIVCGLCELYATVNFAAPEKKKEYEKPIHEMLDRILEVGRNRHGLFYDEVNPKTGQILNRRLADTWGYTLNGYYTACLIDNTDDYRRAVLKALNNLNANYKDYDWENGSADGYADSIESALNLYNREPVLSAAEWIDSQIKVMWDKQQPDGIIEGWHGDGNFARTSIMYCLWKTQGLTIRPWRRDVVFGGAREGDTLCISMRADKQWEGKIIFDAARHKTNMKLPVDWPRINQFPEWFTVEAEKHYEVRNLTAGSHETYTGVQLHEGIRIAAAAGAELRLLVEPAKTVAAPGRVEVMQNDSFLQVEAGEEKILRYNHTAVQPPKGASGLYARSGFVHPLWSPAGKILTAIHPADHIHHMGIWKSWTKTKFEGRDVDFWNIGDAKGTVRFARFASTTAGAVFGGFGVIHEHVDLRSPGGEKIALNEQWDVRVWNVGGADKGYRLIDFTTTESCASSSGLELLKYRYGGFAFRATEDWNIHNSNYLTSEGKTRKDGHGTVARWCNIFGETKKGFAGILFMSHPANRDHPEPMRIWPEGKVFFNFCPIQKAGWRLEPGNEYVLKYRLCIYDGVMTAETAERFWQDFGDGPRIDVDILRVRK